MTKKNDVICLSNHKFPCGLHPTCPFTHEEDACERVTVERVPTDELLERTDSEVAEDYYVFNGEFDECEWLIFSGEDGGVCIEMVKNEEYPFETIQTVGEVIEEALLYLDWELQETYYEGRYGIDEGLIDDPEEVDSS